MIPGNRFPFVPSSTIDCRNGEWQDRKRAWIGLGIKSEVGRDDALTYDGPARYYNWYKVKNYGGELRERGTSVFDPVLCELVYRWFCPTGGTVVDPFAGGSVRGIVAAMTGRRYWGCDLRLEQIRANVDQANDLLPGAVVGPDDQTPIVRVGDFYLKRDDLCEINGARGGKARTCWALARDAKVGLVTAGARQSPQVMLVARMARALGLPCVAHVPSGKIEDGPVAEARDLGAEIIQHTPGYNTVIVARAREYAEATGFTLIPFGMECWEAVEQTRRQVADIPPDVQRIVVPVGSGMSLAGILWGLVDSGRQIPVRAIRVGADPSDRLDRYAPAEWRQMATVVEAGVPYERAVVASVDRVELDPIYEAKCRDALWPGDLLWIVGHRKADPDPLRRPIWVAGDSSVTLPDAPEADLIFSCPPYGDLEVYSDDPRDLSTMGLDGFRAAYRDIIGKACSRLRRDRFAVWVVGEYRTKDGVYPDFVGDTIRAFEGSGLQLYNHAAIVTMVGSGSMRARRQFESGRKLVKTHQDLLVFAKGDPGTTPGLEALES